MRFRSIVDCLKVVVVGMVLCASWQVSAQDDKKEKPVESKTLQAADGWPLKITYYRSSEGKEAAAVILLHGKNENRLVWTGPKGSEGFAESLHKKGFAVITVDLRKHGQSKPGEEDSEPTAVKKDKAAKKSSGSELKPGDYQAMVADMETIKKFIYEEHQKGHLNMRKTAIVAPGMSAAIAVVFATNDWAKTPYDDAPTLAARTPRGQDVQALVLLSPETNLPGVLSLQVAGGLKATPLASLVVVSKGDTQDKDQSKKLFAQLGGDTSKTAAPKKAEPKKAKEKDKEKEAEKEKEERHFFVELPGKLRGTELLGKRLGIEDAMLNFLKDHAQDRKGAAYEWRDRQSRLTSD